MCPYLTKQFKAFKIFIKPNGDISLCNRNSIGNILDSNDINEMFKSNSYKDNVIAFKKCRGCWIGCFITPMIKYEKILNKL
jgi:radical SAM protein with 4Fe4S-binding SPASM domain